MNTTKHYAAGDVIFAEGDAGDWAALIDEGRVEITTLRDGQPYLIGTRGADALIGEMAIIDGGPRSATVRAIEPVSLSPITRADLASRLESTDSIVRLVTQILLQRLRDTLARLRIEEPGGRGFANSNEADAAPDEQEQAALAMARDKIRLTTQLKDALAQNQMSLNYQPVVHLHTGDIVGFEALMRWHLPEGGSVPPNVFIPLAEESELICSLTRFAIKESFAASLRLNKARPDTQIMPWFMGVNISGRDLAQPDFVSNLTQMARDGSVMPSLIKLEITESMMMQSPAQVRNALLLAQAEGFETALDDFGTGYSSLSYLHSFPINVLKIDRSFVQQFLTEEKSRALVAAIIQLARSLGMVTLAEGIERPEEASILAELGCDLAQGYYFARPLPLENALKVANSWQSKPAR